MIPLDTRTKKNHMTIAGTGAKCPACGKRKRQFVRQGHANTKYTAEAARFLNPKPKAPISETIQLVYLVYTETQRVVDDLNLSLEKGQLLCILGGSGCGKTTLLRCLNFLETPDEGEILVNGKVLTAGSDDEIRQNRLHFGLVFQNFNLFPQYTALENVMLAPSLKRLKPKEELRQDALALLAQVGLSNRADNYPWQLSGGQKQRTAIARALAMKPEVLCFDEPTSALDPELTGEVLRTIRGLKEQNYTMIVVTHEMEFARNVADVVIYMADGVIEEMGTPEQIFTAPRSQRTARFIQASREGF